MAAVSVEDAVLTMPVGVGVGYGVGWSRVGDRVSNCVVGIRTATVSVTVLSRFPSAASAGACVVGDSVDDFVGDCVVWDSTSDCVGDCVGDCIVGGPVGDCVADCFVG